MSRFAFIIVFISISLFAFSQNNPPTANPGGPYYGTSNEGIGIPVTLDGRDSYDVDMPLDEIVRYKWDTDGDGLYGADDTDGSPLFSGVSDAEGAEVDVVTNWFPGDAFPISLIVEDSHGALSSAANTSLNIIANTTEFPVNIHDLQIAEAVKGNAAFFVKISHPYSGAQTFTATFKINEQVVVCYDNEDSAVSGLVYAGDNVKTEYNLYFDSNEFPDAVSAYTMLIELENAGETYEKRKNSSQFTIDNTAPEITCPGNQDRAADHTDTYTVTGTEFDLVSATDAQCVPSVVNDINSLETLAGYSFGQGNFQITWTAEDDAGNTSSCNFTANISAYTDIINKTVNDILIYPNPAMDYINIDFQNFPTGYSLKLIGPDGRIVYERTSNKRFVSVDLSGFNNGIYFLMVSKGKELLSTRKIIVHK